MRLIPRTMATQHPDNASKAFWLGKSFIDSRAEVDESFVTFEKLDCDEFMWDWEGKHVDEGVIERLLEENVKFFEKKSLGKDFFLTYRLPNIWIEKGSYRVLRAFANILNAHDIFKDLKFHTPPIFEVIIPMVTSEEQIFYIQKKFADLAKFLRDDKGSKIGSGNPSVIEMIPLVEDTQHMLEIDTLLERYIKHYNRSKLADLKKIKYMRPFIARSDPALNYGSPAAVLGIKIALSKIYAAEKRFGVKMFPIIGCGGVPFRGGLTPYNVKNFLEEYSGFKTLTIQSSFRYDYPVKDVQKAIKTLNSKLKGNPKKKNIKPDEEEKIKKIIKIFKGHYRNTLTPMTEMINKFASFIPGRRERKLHVGLFGYSRGFGKVSLPRAIKFTASLYSIGIPPEIIGTGKGLRDVQKAGLLDTLFEHYIHLKEDLQFVCAYVNLGNIKRLKKKYAFLESVEEDIKAIKEILNIPIGPQTNEERIHQNLTSNIVLFLQSNKDATALIEEAGELRRFLG